MLEELLESTRRRIPAVVARGAGLHAEAEKRGRARGFAEALAQRGLQIIAEVKRRSPSAGPIADALDPAGTARLYEQGGAAAVSVLTEPDYFHGSLDDLHSARAAVSLPVLRKDFILDPAQVWESRAAGADAVLLIVAALGAERLGELLAVASEAGLDALVEAHTESEVRVGLDAGAVIVGVNNRDLSTFVTDLGVAERLAPLLAAEGVVTVAESGITSSDGARRMAAAGYDAVLVGEAAVRAPDTAGFLRSLREAGS